MTYGYNSNFGAHHPMRNALASAVLVLISTFAFATAAGVPTSVDLPPITVKLPTSPGWEMLRNNGQTLAMKRDDGTVAYVQAGRWPAPKSREEFEQELRRNVDEMGRSMNWKILGATYSQRRDRPYPCMQAQVVLQVELTAAVHGRDGALNGRFRVLACHSLDKLQHAFMAGYSYFSDWSDPIREAEADAFLGGVSIKRAPDRKTK